MVYYPVIGKCLLPLEHKYELLSMSFLVVDTKSVLILGLELCKNLKLIKCICRVESKESSFSSEFSDCFGEIGNLNKTHHIEMKGNFTAVVILVQWISHAVKLKVEKEDLRNLAWILENKKQKFFFIDIIFILGVNWKRNFLLLVYITWRNHSTPTPPLSHYQLYFRTEVVGTMIIWFFKRMLWFFYVISLRWG